MLPADSEETRVSELLPFELFHKEMDSDKSEKPEVFYRKKSEERHGQASVTHT